MSSELELDEISDDCSNRLLLRLDEDDEVEKSLMNFFELISL